MEMLSRVIISVLHGVLVQAVTSAGPKGQRPEWASEAMN